MGLTLTIQGQIYFDDLDAIGTWSIVGDGHVDTADKVSGSGSFAHSLGATYCFSKPSLNVGAGSGRRVHVWVKAVSGSIYGFVVGSSQLCSSSSTSWTKCDATIPDAITGFQTCKIDYGGSGKVDHLIICLNDNIKITGLVPAQKVELYRSSGDVLLDTQTVAAGATTVTFSNVNEDFPEWLYLIIYASDGTTLNETTASTLICGGDEYAWGLMGGTVAIEADQFLIYRQGSAGIPQTATITATLVKADHTRYAGKTLQLSTSVGTLSASSGVTDVNGQVIVTLTADDFGLAIVKAQWTGDSLSPASNNYATIHVFNNVEEGRPNQGFQLYCEGYPLQFSGGNYEQSSDVIGTFSVNLREWSYDIVPMGIISIYRKGVLDFRGVLGHLSRQLKVPNPPLAGKDISSLLDDRVVDSESYAAKTPGYIITDLLTKYPCGISAGNVAGYSDTLTIDLVNLTLRSAVQKLCDVTGWSYRVNTDLTLDIATSFGIGLTTVTITEGDNLLDAGWLTDYTMVKTAVHVLGGIVAGVPIISSAIDTTSAFNLGIHEQPMANVTITDQSTLNKSAQTKVDVLSVTLQFKDTYSPGTFGLEDQVTMDSPTLILSGAYPVKRIKRDLSNADWVELDLNKRRIEDWEFADSIMKQTREVAAAL